MNSEVSDNLTFVSHLVFPRMSLYKDEMYVAWDTRSGNIINHLYDFFVVDGKLQKVDVHIFLHQSKLRDQRLVDWPENFIFHFTSTPSSNALQTSLIAYVLEKFERLSRELELEEVACKSNVFFIQDSATQFEELKSMLYKIPYIKNAFTFKLLSLTDEMRTDMLFQVWSNKRSSPSHNHDADLDGSPSASEGPVIDLYGVSSPRSVRHGRRASEFPTPSVTPLSFKGVQLSRTNSQPVNGGGPGSSSCKHCDRRRGSQAKFNMMDKKFFCMACFLEGKNQDNDLCRICQRSKDFTVEEKSTMTSSKIGQGKSISIQCDLPVHDLKDSTTQTSGALQATSSAQTMISIPVDLPENLQKKLDDLMREIDAWRIRPDIPDIEMPQNDDPFRLVDAQVNPITSKFDCPFCEGKSFAKISIFEVHLRNVHKKCNCSCERYFQSREDYLDHFYTVFPLPCFEQRKCPERFRSVPYQAIHHAKVHFAEKPYCCVFCFQDSMDASAAASSNKTSNVGLSPRNSNKIQYRFKSVRALQQHAKEMGHDEDELFLRVKNTEENSHVPLTGRASAINFSGDY